MTQLIRNLAPSNNALFNAVNQQASGGQMARMAPQVLPVGSPVTQDPVPPWAMPKPPRRPYRSGQDYYDERDWKKALTERPRQIMVPVWRKPYNNRSYNPFTPLNGERPNYDIGEPRPKKLPHTTGTGLKGPTIAQQSPMVGPPSNTPNLPMQPREGRWL